MRVFHSMVEDHDSAPQSSEWVAVVPAAEIGEGKMAGFETPTPLWPAP